MKGQREGTKDKVKINDATTSQRKLSAFRQKKRQGMGSFLEFPEGTREEDIWLHFNFGLP